MNTRKIVIILPACSYVLFGKIVNGERMVRRTYHIRQGEVVIKHRGQWRVIEEHIQPTDEYVENMFKEKGLMYAGNLVLKGCKHV